MGYWSQLNEWQSLLAKLLSSLLSAWTALAGPTSNSPCLPHELETAFYQVRSSVFAAGLETHSVWRIYASDDLESAEWTNRGELTGRSNAKKPLRGLYTLAARQFAVTATAPVELDGTRPVALGWPGSTVTLAHADGRGTRSLHVANPSPALSEFLTKLRSIGPAGSPSESARSKPAPTEPASTDLGIPHSGRFVWSEPMPQPPTGSLFETLSTTAACPTPAAAIWAKGLTGARMLTRVDKLGHSRIANNLIGRLHIVRTDHGWYQITLLELSP